MATELINFQLAGYNTFKNKTLQCKDTFIYEYLKVSLHIHI